MSFWLPPPKKIMHNAIYTVLGDPEVTANICKSRNLSNMDMYVQDLPQILLHKMGHHFLDIQYKRTRQCRFAVISETPSNILCLFYVVSYYIKWVTTSWHTYIYTVLGDPEVTANMQITHPSQYGYVCHPEVKPSTVSPLEYYTFGCYTFRCFTFGTLQLCKITLSTISEAVWRWKVPKVKPPKM